VATCNNINALPPEFLRKGRFDEIFSVTWPNEEERLAILKLHIKKRNHSYHHLNLSQIVKITDKFSGADIEAGIGLAVEKLFFSGRDELKLTDEDLKEAFENITPLSKALEDTMNKQQNRLQEYNIKTAS
jgi:SpoVK/Ycf46/Vps4 family AAA+-type ATPase